MAKNFDQKRKDRFLFLEKLYDESGADTSAVFDMWEIGRELQLDHNEIGQIVDYLIGEGLIRPYGLGGTITITHQAIKEIEQAKSSPNSSTTHFPPFNIINIGTMTNSTLQQATSHSTINFGADSKNQTRLTEILQSLNRIQSTLNLSVDAHQELLSEIQTLESQHKSPRPKGIIITESLKSVKTILETVAGNTGAAVLGQQIVQLLS